MTVIGSAIQDSLKSFLAEDIGNGDITSNAIVDSRAKGEGVVVCKEKAVVAGLEESLALLELIQCDGKPSTHDGESVSPGERILSVSGPARALLSVERTLLNLLSHMSGVATATAELVSIVHEQTKSNVRVACTRKTLPGLRFFEKRAVELGGGDTHRLRLDDAVLIKDNHLAFSGSIADTIRKAKEKASFTKKIEVEVTTPNEAETAARAGADIVLLDNMTPQQVKKAVELLKVKGLRKQVIIEASGGIVKSNIADYAKTGIDVISVGAITNSAKAVDMSLKLRAFKK